MFYRKTEPYNTKQNKTEPVTPSRGPALFFHGNGKAMRAMKRCIFHMEMGDSSMEGRTYLGYNRRLKP